MNDNVISTAELRDMLAQAAALAVVAVRNNKYESAFLIADKVLNNSAEVREHRERVREFRYIAEALSECISKTETEV